MDSPVPDETPASVATSLSKTEFAPDALALRTLAPLSSPVAWSPPPPTPTVAELGRVYGRPALKWAVGGTTLAAVLSLLSAPSFTAGSQLYLGELEGRPLPGLGGEDLDLAGTAQSDVTSEVEILRSRSQLEQAVVRSGYNVRIQYSGASTLRHYRWLLSGRSPAEVDGALDVLRSRGSMLAVEQQSPQRLEVVFETATDYAVLSPDNESLGRSRLGSDCLIGGTTLHLEPGPSGPPRPGSHFTLTLLPQDDALKALARSLQISIPKSAGPRDMAKVVALTLQDRSPTVAAEFLNTLTSGYLKTRLQWKTEDTGAAESFVTQQLDDAKRLLDELQARVASHRMQNDVVALDKEPEAIVNLLSRYEEQKIQARLEIDSLKSVLTSLDKPGVSLEAHLLGGANDPVLQDLTRSLSQARQDLAQAEARYLPAAPEVREQHSKVEAHLAAIRGYVKSRLERAEKQLSAVSSVVTQYQDRLQKVPQAEVTLQQLERETAVYRDLYAALLLRKQQTAMVKASTVSKNRVLDVARPNYREDKPNLAATLLALPFAGLFGLVFTLGRRYLSEVIMDSEECRRLGGAAGWTVEVPARRRRTRRREQAPRSVLDVIGEDTSEAFLEGLRRIRANLYASRVPAPVGATVLVTSPSSGDGRTTCALGLASMLAADGRSVLVIDADMRGHVQDGIVGQTAGEDLRAVLSGQCDWRDAVKSVNVARGAVYALAADGGGPAELLTSSRMLEFLREAKSACDYVILDTPPFPAVADAMALSRVADVVITVLRPGNTERRSTRDHLRELMAAPLRHAVVINNPGDRTGPTSRGRRPSREGASSRGGRTMLGWAGAALAALVLIWSAWLARSSLMPQARLPAHQSVQQSLSPSP